VGPNYNLFNSAELGALRVRLGAMDVRLPLINKSSCLPFRNTSSSLSPPSSAPQHDAIHSSFSHGLHSLVDSVTASPAV